MTEDCDRAAFACVAQLAEELLPGCNGRRLVNEWRPLFHASPWCPEGKVGAAAIVHRSVMHLLLPSLRCIPAGPVALGSLHTPACI